MKTISKIIIVLSLLGGKAYSQDKIEIEDVKNPLFISVNEKGLFITEENTLAIYSPDKYFLKSRIGNQDDEKITFKYPPMLTLYPDYIFVNSFTKFAKILSDGKIIQIKDYYDLEDFNSSSELMFFPIKDKYIKRLVDHNSAQQNIHLVDNDFIEIKRITDAYYDFNKLPDDLENYKLLSHYTGIEVFNDRVYVGDTKKGFHFDVFDSMGKLLNTIDKNIEKLAVTAEFKTKALDEMKAQVGFYNYLSSKKAKFSFYDHFPAFRYFLVANQKIYVFTFKVKNNNHELMILDLKGNLIKTVFLPLQSLKALKFTGSYDLLTVYDDIIYELIQNAITKKWELHITDINKLKSK